MTSQSHTAARRTVRRYERGKEGQKEKEAEETESQNCRASQWMPVTPSQDPPKKRKQRSSPIPLHNQLQQSQD